MPPRPNRVHYKEIKTSTIINGSWYLASVSLMEGVVWNVTNWRGYVLSEGGGSYSAASYSC